jgi:hypothetical protein
LWKFFEEMFGAAVWLMFGKFAFCGEQRLQRYLTEFQFRYDNRSGLGVTDGERRLLLSRVSRAGA